MLSTAQTSQTDGEESLMPKSRGRSLTEQEFMLAVDNAGGLYEATVNGNYSAKDLHDKTTELYWAMRAWDRYIVRLREHEARVINAMLP